MEFDRMGVEEIKQSIREKLENNFGCGLSDATPQQLYQAVARTVRDEVMRRRTASRGVRKTERKKKVYYLCAEFLTGRALHSNIVNLVNEDNYAQALKELGINEDAIFELEPEPGLGNGGLGRLAACFLDALTTMELPAMGCTIRYEFGLFRQKLIDGYQAEVPDNWLESGNIWEIPRPDETVEVHFGGRLEEYTENGRLKYRHLDYKTVEAVPYDIPVVGYDSCMVNMLRVWSRGSKKQIDMASFNSGSTSAPWRNGNWPRSSPRCCTPTTTTTRARSCASSSSTSSLRVHPVRREGLYQGLRLQLAHLPDKVAIHINDTHPAIAIPELMRILVDEYELDWDFAQDICYRTFAYTNHTVMQEALERWPEDMFRVQLPRIYMILSEMNRRLCQDLWDAFPGQWTASPTCPSSPTGSADGQPGRGLFALGQRRFRHPHRHSAQADLPRLRHAAAAQVRFHHQRHHPPPLADAGQPRPVQIAGRGHRHGLAARPAAPFRPFALCRRRRLPRAV